MSHDIQQVHDAMDDGWRVDTQASGEVYPPNNRLVLLIKGASMREYYLSADDYDAVIERHNNERPKTPSEVRRDE